MDGTAMVTEGPPDLQVTQNLQLYPTQKGKSTLPASAGRCATLVSNAKPKVIAWTSGQACDFG